MIFEIMPVGPFQCNAILLGCEKTRQAVLIDPGDEASRLRAAVEKNGLTLKFLLHTHAHFDHAGATTQLKRELNAQTCLHRDDEILFNQLPMQGKFFGFEFETPDPIDIFLADEEEVTFGEHRLQVIHTPGHSPGGVCFHLQGSEGWLFSGDTLFDHSIGRTDLWGGDTETLLRSIRERLFILDDEMKVFPGHGPSTLLGIEKRENPFLG